VGGRPERARERGAPCPWLKVVWVGGLGWSVKEFSEMKLCVERKEREREESGRTSRSRLPKGRTVGGCVTTSLPAGPGCTSVGVVIVEPRLHAIRPCDSPKPPGAEVPEGPASLSLEAVLEPTSVLVVLSLGPMASRDQRRPRSTFPLHSAAQHELVCRSRRPRPERARRSVRTRRGRFDRPTTVEPTPSPGETVDAELHRVRHCRRTCCMQIGRTMPSCSSGGRESIRSATERRRAALPADVAQSTYCAATATPKECSMQLTQRELDEEARVRPRLDLRATA